MNLIKEASMNQSPEGNRTHRPYTLSKVPHKVRIGLHLRGNISPEKIRRDLAVAVAFGLDPREVYVRRASKIYRPVIRNCHFLNIVRGTFFSVCTAND